LKAANGSTRPALSTLQLAKYSLADLIGFDFGTSCGSHKVSVTFRPTEVNAQEIDLGHIGKASSLD
jgi:hypothetical protein